MINAVFFVLNNASLLTSLVSELNSNDIKGGTIFNSDGIGRQILNIGELQIHGSLKSSLNLDYTESKTFLFVIDEVKIPKLIEIIEKVVGNLDNVNTGILFSFPLSYVKGLKY